MSVTEKHIRARNAMAEMLLIELNKRPRPAQKVKYLIDWLTRRDKATTQRLEAILADFHHALDLLNKHAAFNGEVAEFLERMKK